MIGDPVRHSRSPAIFNTAFSATGLDWIYTAFEVPAGRGGDAIAAMRVLDLGGLSVTMPHKAAVIPELDEITPEAEVLGAVNCVTNSGGHITGHNTDGAGYVASLRSAGIEPQGMRCVVIGAGGAARAVIHALALAGAGEVAVSNRDQGRARSAADLAPTGTVVPPGKLADAVGSADLVTNATPLGMAEGDPPVLDVGDLKPDLVVSDLVYAPETTPLLGAAASAGCRTVGGLGMLVHQAAVAFELMTGVRAPVDAMARAGSFAPEN
ncbi:MAG: shikimate dehydrogenase [Microthrixaceae bacterium]